MARKRSPHFTDTELRLMEILWAHEGATVAEVVEELGGDPPPAYSTVITTLRILETKGHVSHIKRGRSFIYRAVVDREEACETAVAHLLRRFFRGSPELLMLNLLDSRKIGAKELARLRRRIEEESDQ
jgi:predicted transcriptional regulator